jgi:hypothetical protein
MIGSHHLKNLSSCYDIDIDWSRCSTQVLVIEYRVKRLSFGTDDNKISYCDWISKCDSLSVRIIDTFILHLFLTVQTWDILTLWRSHDEVNFHHKISFELRKSNRGTIKPLFRLLFQTLLWEPIQSINLSMSHSQSTIFHLARQMDLWSEKLLREGDLKISESRENDFQIIIEFTIVTVWQFQPIRVFNQFFECRPVLRIRTPTLPIAD